MTFKRKLAIAFLGILALGLCIPPAWGDSCATRHFTRLERE